MRIALRSRCPCLPRKVFENEEISTRASGEVVLFRRRRTRRHLLAFGVSSGPLQLLSACNHRSQVHKVDINTSFTHEAVSQINKVSDASNLKVTSIDSSQIIDITVVGNQAIDIGQVVEIDISSPEPASDNREGKIDKRFSGKYYVYAKRDVFNEDTHNMSLGLVKESQLEG